MRITDMTEYDPTDAMDDEEVDPDPPRVARRRTVPTAQVPPPGYAMPYYAPPPYYPMPAYPPPSVQEYMARGLLPHVPAQGAALGARPKKRVGYLSPTTALIGFLAAWWLIGKDG